MAGVVVLLAYSRPTLLRQCLDSLYNASGSEQTIKVLVLQPGNAEVEELIGRRADDSTVTIRSPAQGSTPTQRMMSQFWLGIEVALAHSDRDWIMTLEEDSLLSEDALTFVDVMHMRYRGHTHFRGVNLGSVEVDAGLRGTYSLLRYGFMGHAGALPRRHWALAHRLLAKGSSRYAPFDCEVEAALKTGFMVTPNLSKSMNFGWIDGTHVTDEPSVRAHFERMRQSWEMGDHAGPYRRHDIDQGWRHDAVPFLLRDDPRYTARLMKSLVGRAARGLRGVPSRSARDAR